MAMDPEVLADEIYKRLGFRVYTGASQEGLVDDLTYQITGKRVTEKNDDLQFANIFHERLAEIIAEEVINHLENYADITINVPISIDNIRTIPTPTGESTDLAVISRTFNAGTGSYNENTTQGTFDGTATGSASIT